jgi:colanic acid biosynthesis glycosyl transferase WcaI
VLTSVIGALADWSRRNADGIIVLGEDMRARLIARDIPEHKIHVAENWADGQEITPLPFPDGPLTVLYSGNFGLTHDFETIATVIRRYANDARFRFVFAGGGVRRENMESLCREQGIGNAIFRPYAVRAKLPASLAEGHLGLVTPLPRTCGSIVPSKTYGIMAAGRPVLYIGPREATPARMIQRYQCGWQIDPGDTAALATLLEALASRRNLIVDAGARARHFFELHHDRPMSVARIVKILGLEAELTVPVPVIPTDPKKAAAAANAAD